MKSFASVLLLFVAANVHSGKPDSIPIAEYCVAASSSNTYLHLQKVLEEQPNMVGCDSNFYQAGFDRTIKFLIHNDLKAEQISSGLVSDTYNAFNAAIAAYEAGGSEEAFIAARDAYEYNEKAWFFADKISVLAKNGKQIDFSKYYKKGKIVPVEWQIKAKCGSLYNAIYSGSYFIRITRECD